MSVEDLHPWFVGAYGENYKLLEELILDMLRDHVFWRRNFHPESVPPIPTSAQYREDYADFVAKLKHELYRLGADLKQSVPFFSPRYIGHMASDLVLPGLVARMATELYNPNNIIEEVAPVTHRLEVLVGEQLAVMLGYNLTGPVRAFGHLTSGGTIANFEGLRNLLAARLYPLAAAAAAREAEVDFEFDGMQLRDLPVSVLVNQSVERSARLRRHCLAQAREVRFDGWSDLVESHRFEHLGLVEFHRRHPELGRLLVMVASTAHYSWSKAVKLQGLGTEQLVKLPVDSYMRLDVRGLRAAVEDAEAAGDTIVAVVPILGNTEFGAIDPVHGVLQVRDEHRARGGEFGVHVDAAWGGYLRTLFKFPDETLRSRESIADQFRYFPSEPVYNAFLAVAQTDSATVDPHKLGFIPFGAGAYVARNQEIGAFSRESAAYVFEEDGEQTLPMGQLSLEGSKPGAAVASAYVTHRTIPLDCDGFGKIIAQSILSCEAFYDEARRTAEGLRDVAQLVVPFEPDTNLVCMVINPKGNRDVLEANRFMRQLVSMMGVHTEQPVQDRQFFASSTKIRPCDMNDEARAAMFDALGLDPPAETQDIVVIRHTLMNPWLLSEREGRTYVEMYFDYLEELVRTFAGQVD